MAAAGVLASDTSDFEYENCYRMADEKNSPNLYDKIQRNWTDVTNDFKAAANELELGELLHDDKFGLFEAMSAIEMMDPKMDAGMCSRDYKPAKSFDDLVESGVLKMDNLLPNEIVGIIDSTLACTVSWLEGHSLAQTVFTNLYLHKPHQVQDKIMKTFAFAMYKIIDTVKDFIGKAMVFEEEDFLTLNYGYKLKPEVSEPKIIAALKDIEEDMLKRTRNKTVEPKSADSQEDLVAIHARIKFMRLFYQVFLSLNKRDSVTSGETQKLLTSCLDTLQLMHKSVSRGLQPTEGKDGISMLGFDPLINQRLLPPTFPRYTKVKSRVDALDYLEELINRLKVVCRIVTVSSFHNALESLVEFSRHGPCILSRSIMQYLYLPLPNSYSPYGFTSFGNEPCTDVLRDAARCFIAPPSLLPKSPLLTNSQARDYIDTFLTRCVRPFGSLLQLCGLNRARQRDKLARLLEDFAGLQDEAERVDSYLHTLSLKSDSPRPHLACFGTWVLYYTLRVMIMYLLSGLELELYSTHEYHYIFWYLYEFLYGWLVSALSRANSHIMEQESLLEPHTKNRGSKKSKPKKKKTQPFGREMTFNQALQNMCGGYYKAMSGFKLDGKVARVHPAFDNEQVRYEHRFAPFASLLTPPPVHYAEFRETTAMIRCEPGPSSAHLYLEGCRHFHHARTLLEGLPNTDQEVQELLRICKTNFVVLKILADGHKKDSNIPPEFDFKSHPHFPIIKLV